MTDPKPSEQIADAVIDFYSNFSSDGLERDAPTFTRRGLIIAIELKGGLADLESRLEAAERENERLREALNDIGHGNAPSEVINLIDSLTPEEFRHRMWTWSQERARAAIEAEEEGHDR